MIAFLLGPIGRWALVAIAVAGLLTWAHHRVYQQGWQARDAVAQSEAKAAQAAADVETARLQTIAHQAEVSREQARTDLDAYRASHPVSIRVCHAASPSGSLPESAGIGPAGTATSGVFQPVASTDIGPALDTKAAEADGWVEQYRVCRIAYSALSH